MNDYGSLIFYGCIFILTAICAEYSIRSENVFIRRCFAWSAVFIPALVAGFRYGIGTDYTEVYLAEFNNLKLIPHFKSRMEFGYVILNKLVLTLDGGFPLVMFLVSFITILFIYLGLTQYKEKISVGLGMLVFMLLFYQISFNAVRQLTAVAIMFYAIKYIYERKLIKFLLFTIFACGFHITALILFPFYFLNFLYGKPKYKILRFISYTALIILALNYNILYPIVAQVHVLSYYAGYLRQTKKFILSIGMFVRTLPFLLPAIIFYHKIQKKHQILLNYNMLIMGCIIRLTAYTSTYYIERIAYYFLISLIVLIPFYYRQFKKKGMTFLGVSLVGLVIYLWFYDFYLMGNSDTIPYHFYFESEKFISLEMIRSLRK